MKYIFWMIRRFKFKNRFDFWAFYNYVQRQWMGLYQKITTSNKKIFTGAYLAWSGEERVHIRRVGGGEQEWGGEGKE